MSNNPKVKKSSIPGYDATGRTGTINLTETFGTQETTKKERPKTKLYSKDPDERKKQQDSNMKTFGTLNPTAEGKRDIDVTSSEPTYDMDASFSPDPDKKIPGKPGSMVDTFKPTELRASLRQTDIAKRGEIQRGRKAAKSARKMQRDINKHGADSPFKQSDVDAQKKQATILKKGGGEIAQSQFENGPNYTASAVSQGSTVNPYDTNRVEYGRNPNKATEPTTETPIVTQSQKDAGYKPYESFTQKSDVNPGSMYKDGDGKSGRGQGPLKKNYFNSSNR